MYCTVLTVRYSTVLFSTVQYSMVLYGTVRYSTVQYGMVWYSMVLYSILKLPETNFGDIFWGGQKKCQPKNLGFF